MKNNEPFIVDILCKNVDPMSPLNECHVIGCAITSSPKKASIIIQDRLIADCFVTIFVSSIKSSGCIFSESNTLESELIKQAHESPSNHSLVILTTDTTSTSQSHLAELYSYINRMQSQ
jgi:hypothetical protein